LIGIENNLLCIPIILAQIIKKDKKKWKKVLTSGGKFGRIRKRLRLGPPKEVEGKKNTWECEKSS